MPDIVGFSRGMRALVADDGWVSIEVMHLLARRREFEMVYSEHCQYLTIETARAALAAGDLAVVDIEPVDDDGSIRLWARPFQVAGQPTPSVRALLAAEGAAGLHSAGGHLGLAEAIPLVREDLIAFLVEARARATASSAAALRAEGTPCSSTAELGPTCSGTS